MKKCEKCSKSFKTYIKINGKVHNLASRKYCLQCSPFKRHNTKKIIDIPPNTKKCGKCGEIKNIEEFHKQAGVYKSPCQKCCILSANLRQYFSKLSYVNYKGGKCEICGYHKNIAALCFHHIDPTAKEFNIQEVKSRKLNS